MNVSRYINQFLVCALGLSLQLWFGPLPAPAPDFALVTLVVLAFFANFLELFFYEALAVWLLSFRPTLPLDLWVFFLLPTAILFLRRFMPWQTWINNLLSVGAVVLAYYLVVFRSEFSVLLLSDLSPVILFDLAWGALVFYALRYFAGYRSGSATVFNK